MLILPTADARLEPYHLTGSPLTPREAECLRLVSQGITDEQIAVELNISPRTVRFHIGNAKTKLGVTTRIQAVAKRLGAA